MSQKTYHRSSGKVIDNTGIFAFTLGTFKHSLPQATATASIEV